MTDECHKNITFHFSGCNGVSSNLNYKREKLKLIFNKKIKIISKLFKALYNGIQFIWIKVNTFQRIFNNKSI